MCRLNKIGPRTDPCQKDTHSENGRVGRLHREKCQRIHILKERESECSCSAERIEAIAIQCTFVMESQRKKNLQNVIAISNVVENFIIHETMLSAIFYLSVSFRSRSFLKPRISTISRRAQKNTSKISWKYSEKGMTRRMSFYKKRCEACEIYCFR